MPENKTRILPFHGLRYALNTETTLESVTAPPFDAIDQSMQDILYASHPHNIVRLILNAVTADDSIGDNAYTRASAHFRHWQSESILTPEKEPAMYAYTQSWEDDAIGKTLERKGILTLLQLPEEGSNRVIPHENTLKGPILDRMNLMQSTLGNFCPIFLLYADPKRQLEGDIERNHNSLDWTTAIDNANVTHAVAPITAPAQLAKLEELMDEQTLLIADGHHRYQTALAFKAEARKRHEAKTGKKAPEGSLLSDYVLVFLANIHDDGLKIYPTHRVLYHWPEGFDKTSFETELLKHFDVVQNGEDFSYTASGETPKKLKLKNQSSLSDLHPDLQSLDTAILEYAVFRNIFKKSGEDLKISHTLGFLPDVQHIQTLAKHGDVVATFHMAQPQLPLIKKICEAGHRLPQKSTYFYPKLLSGLVLYSYAPFPESCGIRHALADVKDEAGTLSYDLFTLEQDAHRLALIPD